VLPDPRELVSRADLRSQLSFLLRIRDDLTRIGARINKLRHARMEVDKVTAAAATLHSPDAANAIAAFDRSVDAALNGLYQPADLAGEDDIRDPIHAYEKLNSLAGFVNAADVAPRPADIDELNVLEGQMRSGVKRADDVLSQGVAALDSILTKEGLHAVRVR
jgi:hypothetical protein